MPTTVSAPSQAPPSLVTSGEKLYSPAAIAKLIPSHRDKSHVNASTVFRWIVRGAKTPSGEVVRLEAAKIGVFWRTSLEAVARFSAKLTAASLPTDDPPAAPPASTPAQRSRAAKAASKQADEYFGTAN
jgi:hypothetical protein